MYYINLGRWARSIIGPFSSWGAADDYIDRMGHWQGRQRPTIVTIAPPKPHTRDVAFANLTASEEDELRRVLADMRGLNS